MTRIEKYEQILRPQMYTGDLIECGPTDAVGKLISWKTGGYSHSAMIIRLPDTYDKLHERVVVVEATSKGIHRSYFSVFLRYHRGRIDWFPLKSEYDSKRFDIGQCATHYELLAIPYDFKALFKNAFKRPQINLERLYCTELVQACYLKEYLIADTIARRPGEMDRDFMIFDKGDTL